MNHLDIVVGQTVTWKGQTALVRKVVLPEVLLDKEDGTFEWVLEQNLAIENEDIPYVD
jgi:hypothetical protein